MKTISLSDIDIYDVGNAISLAGAIWCGRGQLYLVPFPNTSAEDMQLPQALLAMNPTELERFLHQSDVLDVQGHGHAILRKSQRIIDSTMQWKVFHRDGYRCRYCGERRPLTVDHVILWENGGATVEDNLISSCRRCNKLRGSMEYDQWMESNEYRKLSRGLYPMDKQTNLAVVATLDRLRSIQAKVRSR